MCPQSNASNKGCAWSADLQGDILPGSASNAETASHKVDQSGYPFPTVPCVCPHWQRATRSRTVYRAPLYLPSKLTHSPSVQDSYKRLQKCLRKINLKRGLQGVCNGWSWPTRQDLKRVQTSIRLQCIDRMAQYGAHLSTPPGEINQPRFRSMRRTKRYKKLVLQVWNAVETHT